MKRYLLLFVFFVSMFFSLDKVYAYGYYNYKDLESVIKEFKRYDANNEKIKFIIENVKNKQLGGDVEFDGETYDIFLFVGQSNMYGAGSVDDSDSKLTNEGFEVCFNSDYTYGGLRSLGNTDTVKCANTDKALSNTLIPSFVKSYSSNTGHKVFVIHDAVSGSSIVDWQEGTANYERIKKKLEETVDTTKTEYKIGGVYLVWYQGEADACTLSDADLTEFKTSSNSNNKNETLADVCKSYPEKIQVKNNKEYYVVDGVLRDPDDKDKGQYWKISADKETYESLFNKFVYNILNEDVNVNDIFMIRMGNILPYNYEYLNNKDNTTKFIRDIVKYNYYTKMIELQSTIASRTKNVVLVSTKSALLSQIYSNLSSSSFYANNDMFYDQVHLSQFGLDIIGADAGYNAAYYVNVGDEPNLIDYYNFDVDSDTDLPYYYIGYDENEIYNNSGLTTEQEVALKKKIESFVNNGNDRGLLQYGILSKYKPYHFKLHKYAYPDDVTKIIQYIDTINNSITYIWKNDSNKFILFTNDGNLRSGDYIALDCSGFVSTMYHYVFGLPMHFIKYTEEQVEKNNINGGIYYGDPIETSHLIRDLSVNSFDNKFKIPMFKNVLHLSSDTKDYTMYSVYENAKDFLAVGDLIVARNSNTDAHVVMYMGLKDGKPLVVHSTSNPFHNSSYYNSYVKDDNSGDIPFNIGFAFLDGINGSSNFAHNYTNIDVFRLNKNILSKNFVGNSYEVDFDELSADDEQYDFVPIWNSDNINTDNNRLVNEDGNYIERMSKEFIDFYSSTNSISNDNVTDVFYSVKNDYEGISVDVNDRNIIAINAKAKNIIDGVNIFFNNNTAQIVDLGNENIKVEDEISLPINSVVKVNNGDAVQEYKLWYFSFLNNYASNDSNIISKINLNHKLSNVIVTNGDLVIKDKNDNILSINDSVNSGQKINVFIEDKEFEYITSVLGDVTGSDGVNLDDIEQIYDCVRNKCSLDEVYALASDITFDNEIRINDVAKLYAYLKGKIDKLD